MQFKDYYETLGVSPEAKEADIKTAYRRLARKFHPDVSKEAGAEDRFKAINEAHEALRDPERRAAYDQLRRGGFRAGQEYQPPNGHPGFGFDPRDPRFSAEEGSGFSDFFESLFGRGRPGERAGPGPRPADQTARIQIDIETAYAGGVQRLRIDERTLEVKIPRGVTPGQQIRLAGQARGGGDLRLEISYRPHPWFRVEGRDVLYSLPVAPWEVALGAEIDVPTLAGSVKLKIPAGSDSGKRLRLRGRGLPDAQRADGTGDQIVEVSVRVPPAITDEQRDLYQRMASSFDFDPRRP